MKHSKTPKILILAIFTFMCSPLIKAQTVYDVNFNQISFLNANRTHKVGTDGKAAGNITLYTNVIKIGTTNIDCIVTTASITGGTFLSSLSPSFDYDANGGSMSGNQDKFFSPLFDWNSGGGSCRFNFQFILGGSYVNSTNKGTNVILSRFYVNTYDIDGNGGTNSNQYNEFGGFSSTQYNTSGGYISTSYNSTTNKTKFASTTDQNITNINDDRTRVRVYYENLGNFDFVVGAAGSGNAYYMIDFGPGPAWTTTPSVTTPPVLDLNTNIPGLNNEKTIQKCNTNTSLEIGNPNLTNATNVDQVFVRFETAQILDGNLEILNINGATSGANIPLNFANNATIANVVFFTTTYNVRATVVSGVSQLAFTKASGTWTAAQAERFMDSFRYINTDCISLTGGERNLEVTVREGSFESEKAVSKVNIIIPLPISLISFNAKKKSETSSKITWITASEEQNNYFDVYKSINGTDWRKIGVVNGQGTISSMSSYEFIDNAFNENSFYQLRQVDYNGNISFSNIIYLDKAATKISTTFQAYPNPSKGAITIASIEPSNYEVFDAFGKIIAEGTTNEESIVLNLNKGLYIIKYTNSTASESVRIIVE